MRTSTNVSLKHFRSGILFLIIILLLGACERAAPTQGHGVRETAIFSDADIDQATLVTAVTLQEIVGTELGGELEVDDLPFSETDPLEADESELLLQQVVPGASGFVAYIRHQPGATNPWSLQRHNPTDFRQRDPIYSGNRAIQSVAISLSGGTAGVIMESAASSGLFRADRLDVATRNVTELPNTDNASNISMTADGNLFVWEGDHQGRRAVFLYRFVEGSAEVLNSTVTAPQVQPSVSSNGAHIALLRPGTQNQIMVYSTAAQQYRPIASSSNPLEHPSVSNDGNRVAWLEHSGGNFHVRLRDVSAAATTTLRTASRIDHPHLTSDGLFITYARPSQGSLAVFTREIATHEEVNVAVSTADDFGPYWQTGAPVVSYFTANPSPVPPGGTSTLSWNIPNITGATSVSISPGVGTVTGSSVTVSPTRTTTYTLTATNAAGSVTASTVVVVKDPVTSRSPVIATTADIACDPYDFGFNAGEGIANPEVRCRQQDTFDLLLGMAGLEALLLPGDLQYEDATFNKFMQSYDQSWGRLRSITYPGLGDHEYWVNGQPSPTGTADGYFDYFYPAGGDRDKGYYSFDIGNWHIIALNSICREVANCSNSAQLAWLEATLAANADKCTLAYWHHAPFSSGRRAPGQLGFSSDFLVRLYAAGADVALVAHEHHYERFAKMNPSGNRDPNGIRQFTVGMGGKVLYELKTAHPASEVRNNNTYGVLKMTLHPDSYEWEFVPIAGQSFTDRGSAACNSAPSALAPAPTPSFTYTCSGLTCTFTDTSADAGAIRNWSWRFGDGSTSSARNPTHTYASAGSHTATLTVTNTQAVAGSASQTLAVGVGGPGPAPTPPTINAFTAEPSTIQAGQSSLLSWNASGATSVSISPDVGPVAASGTRAVSPTSTTTYTLTASNAAGTRTATTTVTVIAAPPPPPVPPMIETFNATPGTIQAGQSSTLSWNVTGVTSVSISPGVGEVGASDTRAVSPTSTTTYTLTASNAAGTRTATTTVTVTAAPPPPSADLTVSANHQSVTLWDSADLASTVVWHSVNLSWAGNRGNVNLYWLRNGERQRFASNLSGNSYIHRFVTNSTDTSSRIYEVCEVVETDRCSSVTVTF